MTVWGVRDNVKLIREDANGKQEIHTLDLNKAETILSPYYWLQQNDVVYVTPNKTKARNAGVGTSTESVVLCYLYLSVFGKYISNHFQIITRTDGKK